MDREVLEDHSYGLRSTRELKGEVEARVLRGQLVNLVLEWELAALKLDAQRYRVSEYFEQENLRDSAGAYRRCIAELSGILSASRLLSCKT